MRIAGVFIFIISIILLFPAGLFAQAGDFNVSVDLRTGFNLFGIVPGVPVSVGVPLSISEESVTVTPHFGFLYYFDVMSDLHNPYYVPIGASVLLNQLKTGLDFVYNVPVGGDVLNHMVSASIVSEAELINSGRFSLLLQMKLGTMAVFEPASPRFFLHAESVIIPRVKL